MVQTSCSSSYLGCCPGQKAWLYVLGVWCRVESGTLPDLLVVSNGFWHATRPRYKREHWVHNYAKAVAQLAEASEALQRRAQRCVLAMVK